MIATRGVQRAPPGVEYNGRVNSRWAPCSNQHGYGKSPCLIGKNIYKWAMFDSLATCEITRGYPVLTHS